MGNDEWRFELSDLPDDDEDERPASDDRTADAVDVPDSETSDEDAGNVAGAFAPAGDIEPGSPVLEHVAFVALGVFVTLVLFAGPLLGFTGRQIVTVLVAAALVVAGVVVYVQRTDSGDA